MKKYFLFFLICAAAKMASAQYKPVDKESSLKFTIANLGFDVHGTFTGFQGTITFDPQNPSAGSFDVSIDASTVNTDNSLRDNHLKGASYFDVANNPRNHLVSTKITGKGTVFTLYGHLTIKGKSKDISFPFTADPSGDGYVFKGSFKLNRKDFGVGGTSTIANELEVALMVRAAKA